MPAARYNKNRYAVIISNSQNVMDKSLKGGRPPIVDRRDYCLKIRFNQQELDHLQRLMDKAQETVKSDFIKQVLFGKPFKVLVTDKSLAVYCAKLSEFFSQFRTVGVNYNLIVKELRSDFSEKKAMQYLYKLEKATVEMAKILAEVKALTVKFDEAWSQKSL